MRKPCLYLHPRAGKGLDEDAQRGTRIAAEIPDWLLLDSGVLHTLYRT